MTDLAQLKNKRSSVQEKITRIIKATDKVLSNDIRKLDEEELQMKLQSLQEAIQEHQEAYSALLDAMMTATEEDTEK